MTAPDVRVPFLSLKPGEDADALRAAVNRVIDRGWFILGPELEALETEFAAASGAAHAVGVNTGTDAIALLLRGLGIGPGDEVITAPLSAAYTALAVMMAGARPVFADIDPERHTIDPAAVEAAITPRTAAIMPVHLYGQAADMPALSAIASRHGLAIVEDAAQAHLATCEGRPVGSFGAGAAFSFYPTKNLGALGDGGAITTSDAALADRLKRLRNGGQRTTYQHDEFGVNSRLDEMQAAILRERLQRLPAWTAAAPGHRQRGIARGWPARRCTCHAEFDAGHVYHLFVVRTAQREAFRTHMTAQGIQTLVHYPKALTRQPAIASESPAPCPEAERAADEVCSLPLYPSLSLDDVDQVAAAVSRSAVGAPLEAPAAGRASRPSPRCRRPASRRRWRSRPARRAGPTSPIVAQVPATAGQSPAAVPARPTPDSRLPTPDNSPILGSRAHCVAGPLTTVARVPGGPMSRRVLLAVALSLAAALPVSAQSVSLTLRDGRVTLITQNATPAAILAEWARLGQVKVVDAERVPGTPLTLRLENVPEREALDIVLRGAAGYIAAPRAQALAGSASRFDRVIVMASSPGASTAARAGGAASGARAAAIAPAPAAMPAQVEEDVAQGQPALMEEAPAPMPAPEQPASSTNFDYANPQRYFAARQAEQQAAEAAQQQQQVTAALRLAVRVARARRAARPGMLPAPQPQGTATGSGAAAGQPVWPARRAGSGLGARHRRRSNPTGRSTSIRTPRRRHGPRQERRNTGIRNQESGTQESDGRLAARSCECRPCHRSPRARSGDSGRGADAQDGAHQQACRTEA